MYIQDIASICVMKYIIQSWNQTSASSRKTSFIVFLSTGKTFMNGIGGSKKSVLLKELLKSLEYK